LVVEGHTDAVGNRDNNLALSQARANAVRDALIARGLAAERIDAFGFGESRPIADNVSEAGRSKNRRIVIRVAND
jgi:outer membrane protein OmpA-like peptidoglycan-associated protein